MFGYVQCQFIQISTRCSDTALLSYGANISVITEYTLIVSDYYLYSQTNLSDRNALQIGPLFSIGLQCTLQYSRYRSNI